MYNTAEELVVFVIVVKKNGKLYLRNTNDEIQFSKIIKLENRYIVTHMSYHGAYNKRKEFPHCGVGDSLVIIKAILPVGTLVNIENAHDESTELLVREAIMQPREITDYYLSHELSEEEELMLDCTNKDKIIERLNLDSKRVKALSLCGEFLTVPVLMAFAKNKEYVEEVLGKDIVAYKYKDHFIGVKYNGDQAMDFFPLTRVPAFTYNIEKK